MNNKITAIILSGGSGTRFSGVGPKHLINIAGKPVLEHTLEIFENSPYIERIIIVLGQDFIEETKKLIDFNKFNKPISIVVGGKTRQESSYNGLIACPENTNSVIFHDGVRPLLSGKVIEDVHKALKKYNAVDVAIPVVDTIIKVKPDNTISDIPIRSMYMRGQTPQAFKYKTILNSYRRAIDNNDLNFTDDCGVVMKYSDENVYVVIGSDENIKITYPIDVHIVDKLFQLKNTVINGSVNMPKSLKGSRILIVGDSSGIGKEILKLCKKYTDKVVGISRSTCNVDINNHKKTRSKILEFVKEYGAIDHLVVTAGYLSRNKLEDYSVDEIILSVNTNFTSQAVLVKDALPYMSSNNSSVTLFSSSSYTRGRATYSMYSSSKAAIVNFMQAVSEEQSGKVRLNVICPARTKTPMRLKNFGREKPESLLNASKVAKVTLHVMGSSITGQVVQVRKDDI